MYGAGLAIVCEVLGGMYGAGCACGATPRYCCAVATGAWLPKDDELGAAATGVCAPKVVVPGFTDGVEPASAGARMVPSCCGGRAPMAVAVVGVAKLRACARPALLAGA
jgi:hypothetical protein